MRQIKILKILLPLLLILWFFVWGNGQTQTVEEERIIEKVEVTNVEVPVRVFFKGKPVQGLEKTGFKLFVNGKEKEIHGFYEYKKKLTMTQAPQLLQEPGDIASPRLFLLIFNICDYHLDVSNSLDIFFDKIFRANDRLMVITNHFFFDDRKISNPRQEKMKLKKVLQLELGKTGGKLNSFERRMKSMLRLFTSGSKYGSFKDSKSQDFIRNYRQLVREFKTLYLNIDDKKYFRLAQYLKDQKCEKLVLNFYQVGRFFQPKPGSRFLEELLGRNFTKSKQRYHELQEVLEVGDALLYNDLSKMFADTGAVFHTILMEGWGTVQNDLVAELSYTPIISDSYNLLKKISKKTGGTFMHSNEIEKFYRKIASTDDTYYMLTFVPDKKKNKKNRKIKVTVNNKKYSVFYDDQKRGSYFRKVMKKQERTEILHVRIDQVELKGNLLTFIVSDFKIGDPVTKLQVRLQVFNRKSENLFDGVEMYTIKDLKSSKVRLQIEFPKFPPGDYNVFILVGDPLTGKNDLAVKELNK